MAAERALDAGIAAARRGSRSDRHDDASARKNLAQALEGFNLSGGGTSKSAQSRSWRRLANGAARIALPM